jgi:hypothetical protein
MPLERGKSRAMMSHNIAEMVKSGHGQKQAVAAAYRNAGESKTGDAAKIIADRAAPLMAARTVDRRRAILAKVADAARRGVPARDALGYMRNDGSIGDMPLDYPAMPADVRGSEGVATQRTEGLENEHVETVGDRIAKMRGHDKSHVRDDWSPEAREAAAEARKANAHHTEKQQYHAAEGEKRGENASKPPPGSHTNAASLHGSAAFYHKKVEENPEDSHYQKQAQKNSSLANNASKKIASGKEAYPTAKENDYKGPATKTAQEHSAARISKHLRENRIRMR